MSLWIVFSLAAAFCGATTDALTKKALQIYSEYLVAWLRLILGLPLLFLCLFFTPIPKITAGFIIPSLIALPIELAAYLLYLKAIRISPLSLTMPFLALTPLVLLVIPYIVLGETISFGGGMGILFLALGSYTLHIGDLRKSLWAPFAAIRNEKGSLLMIIVAVLFGLTNTLNKMAIENSSPLFFGATYNAALLLLLTPVTLQKLGPNRQTTCSTGAVKALLWPGVLSSLTVIFYTLSISLTQVAYSVAVNRLSLIMAVLYGHFLFKETGFRERLAGTVFMLAGFVLIVLYQK